MLASAQGAGAVRRASSGGCCGKFAAGFQRQGARLRARAVSSGGSAQPPPGSKVATLGRAVLGLPAALLLTWPRSRVAGRRQRQSTMARITRARQNGTLRTKRPCRRTVSGGQRPQPHSRAGTRRRDTSGALATLVSGSIASGKSSRSWWWRTGWISRSDPF